MELISVERRTELLNSTRSMDKLELRDHYLIDRAALEAWHSQGVQAAQAVLEPTRAVMAARVASGMTLRRVKVVSEPLSEYHRFIHAVSGIYVEAGEDLRYLPRRLTSTAFMPGNDMFVLNADVVIFNVLDGADERAEIQLYQDPDVVKACHDAFEAAWALSVPYDDYRPDRR